MIVRIDKSFQKDLDKILDDKIKHPIIDIIREAQNAESIASLKNFKKLSGHKNKYRIRLGDYRIGLEYSENVLVFIRFLHRKEVYNKWP